jgi:hypothetical protein
MGRRPCHNRTRFGCESSDWGWTDRGPGRGVPVDAEHIRTGTRPSKKKTARAGARAVSEGNRSVWSSQRPAPGSGARSRDGIWGVSGLCQLGARSGFLRVQCGVTAGDHRRTGRAALKRQAGRVGFCGCGDRGDKAALRFHGCDPVFCLSCDVGTCLSALTQTVPGLRQFCAGNAPSG